MNILMAGDIMGSPGRTVFARVAGEMKRTGKADFVVANAENSAAGKGITAKIAEEIFDAGADVITMGDHTWDQKETERLLDRDTRVLRPANFPPQCPGRGFVTIDTPAGKVTVINLIGRVFVRMSDDCPFRAADALLKKETGLGKIILVDFHAEATSEKNAMGRYLDGRVSAVVGTHTHVQTADEQILTGGTAYMTDLGMCGPTNSIIGCDTGTILRVFLTGMKHRFEVSSDSASAVMHGALIDVDDSTGKAKSIKRISE
ncbi:MAG: TIGR00282 family metallophosphoesterase [bacterium]